MYRYDYSFPSLGTICNITIVHENDTGLDTLIQHICAEVQHFDALFSRFKNNSTLSRLNRDRIATVSDDFVDLFRCAKRIYALTDGYFNPLADIRTLGYIANFEDITHFSVQDIPENLDMDAISLSGNELRLQSDMHLDFWAIGKGYIADCIGLSLEQRGYNRFMVNLGGDIVLRGLTQNNAIPTVGIISPSLQGFVAHIAIFDASVSTSGSYVRTWKMGEESYHHIKTPGSHAQNTDLWSVTIVAEHGYESDSLATAVFAMGLGKGLIFCEEHHIDALCVGKNGNIQHTPGFDEKYNLKTEKT